MSSWWRSWWNLGGNGNLDFLSKGRSNWIGIGNWMKHLPFWIRPHLLSNMQPNIPPVGMCSTLARELSERKFQTELFNILTIWLDAEDRNTSWLTGNYYDIRLFPVLITGYEVTGKKLLVLWNYRLITIHTKIHTVWISLSSLFFTFIDQSAKDANLFDHIRWVIQWLIGQILLEHDKS